MFGVGIHFSVKDLLAVGGVAIPGRHRADRRSRPILGTLVGLALGWTPAGAVILGFAVSIASTVVLLRTLIERGELDSLQGRIAVGWLVMQDLFAVAILVLLPTVAPIITGQPNGDSSAPAILGTLGPVGELTWALAARGRIRGPDGGRRPARRALAPGPRGARAIAGAVHAQRPGGGAWASRSRSSASSACRSRLAHSWRGRS